ncbi:MAG: aspartate aminotransferase family protein, partial [Pseudomonadota bacterium]
LGYDIPPFDLSVPGVTSISADIHKYGFAAKGASTIIYKNEKLRRYQYFAYTDFPGGLYGSPTMTGTRPGGGIAAAWAVLNYMGEEGYLEIARRIMDVTKKFQDGIASIPELKILGRPAASVFAFASDDLNIYALGDAMEKRGWHLDRNQSPPSLHIMLTPMHEQAVEPFMDDLKAGVEEVSGSDAAAVSGMAAIYGMVAAIPEKGMVNDLVIDFLSETFKPGSDK